MKRFAIYLTLLLNVLCYQAKAQSLAVESFELAPNDLTANAPGTMVYDQNGNVCALIKIETPHDGFIGCGSSGSLTLRYRRSIE